MSDLTDRTPNKPLLTAGEIARVIGISHNTAKRMLEEGIFETRDVLGRKRVVRQSFIDYLEGKKGKDNA